MQNTLTRMLVDNAAMMNTPLIMQQNQKTATQVAMQQQQANKSISINMATHAGRLKHLINDLLPEQCRQHVYKVDHEHIVSEMCELVKWTFFNDLSVRLKVDADFMMEDGDIRPIIDDMEEWEATALMTCEAGDDVWPRPKSRGSSQSPQGLSSQQSGQANSLNALAQQQGLLGNSINQSAVGNALAGAMGLGGGLFK